MDYKTRLYEAYTSNIQARTSKVDVSGFGRYAKAYRWHLRGWLPENKQAKILDVGCGYGRMLQFFSKRGYTDVTGVDMSPEQIEFARTIHPNVVQANALEFMGGHEEQFDMILAVDLIEHLTKDQILQFLDLSHRALKPGGQLIIQTPNADSPFGTIHAFGDFTHEVFLNINSLGAVMQVCGFTGIEGRETGSVPCGLRYFSCWVLWKFVRLMIMAYNIIETSGPGSGIFTRVFIARGIKS